MLMGYSKYWRIGLIILVVGLLSFGTVLASYPVPCNGPLVEPTTGSAVSPLIGTAGTNPAFPDPNPAWLDSPEDCDLIYYKINKDQNEINSGDTFYGPEGFEVTIYKGVDGDGDIVFAFVSNFQVMHVYAKGGPDGGNLYSYYPDYPNGVTSDCGLKQSDQGGWSHIAFYYCPGQEELTVTKTVVTYFEREHFWDIDKYVETENGYTIDDGIAKIWLDQGGMNDETATWTVDVTYEGSVDSGYKVSGSIIIENTGDLDAVITGVVDLLGGTAIDVDFGVAFPYTLPVGETLTGTYSEDGYFEGENVVTVTTERDTYGDTKDIVWSEDPNLETNKTVNIEDISSEFGTVALGSVTAPNGDSFTYSEDFAWVDYQDLCGGGFEITNTATILETEQSSSALLKINIRCEDLTVTKDVVTYFEREHFWDIEKWVETENGYTVDEGIAKIWLFIDGSGNETATWTVDVTYEGSVDSGFNVSGSITIENTGDLDAVITGVVDVLGGTAIDVDFDVAFPYTLPVGETLTGTYSEEGYFEGFNEVTVTTEQDVYSASEEIIWGDPDEEINATVNIKDISELFGEVDLGTVTAPNGDQFTYDKLFAYEEYDECGSYQYDNTAIIVETGQYAEATLKVNVQCYETDSAWAKGDNPVPAKTVLSFCDNGFSNWGWTNLIEPGKYNWDLWAGAAQCDTDKGTLVGWVVVNYDGTTVDVQFYTYPGYSIEETHVYAGYDMFPQQQRGRRTENTVAPGQYYNNGGFDGSDLYVIAHAVVRIPDPNFGP